jgi:hypothetical protein
MSENTKLNPSPTQNPAKSINPPSLPTKSTRGEVGSRPQSSPGGNRK